MKFLISEIRSIIQSISKSYREAPSELQKGARFVIGGAIVLVVAFKGWSVYADYREEQHRREELALGPHVKTAIAQLAPAEKTVELVGEAKPYAAVTLYARVSGFLKDVRVDKGDVVKKGQVLALIESPETDDAYRAALADARNKKSIAERTSKLLARDLVSPQEAETESSSADVAAARLESAELAKSYETLRAPFSGVVTARYADPGALVQSAQNSQTSAIPLVSLSQVNQLRVYVYVDQHEARAVHKGALARISLNENPDLKLTGHVERVTGELDSKTRMLLAEVDLDNKNEDIVAGSLVKVSLDLKTEPGVTIPSEALVLRDGKTVVPIISSANEVTYSPVKVIDDDGKFVKVSSGLEAGQTVALNLGNTVADHGRVRPAVADVQAKGSTTSASVAEKK